MLECSAQKSSFNNKVITLSLKTLFVVAPFRGIFV